MPRLKKNTGAEFTVDEGDVAVLEERPERVRIVLEENENIPPTGQFISRNGKAVILRPGEEVSVPRWVCEVLDNAVQDVPQIDPSTNQVVGYRKRLRFPYRTLRD